MLFLIYILWLVGIIFTILFLIEVGVVIYKLAQKKEKVKAHIVTAVICIIISIVCISSALFIGVEKILKYDTSYSEMSKSIGQKSADITANMSRVLKKNGIIMQKKQNKKPACQLFE